MKKTNYQKPNFEKIEVEIDKDILDVESLEVGEIIGNTDDGQL